MWQWQISEFEGGRLLAEALSLRIPAAPRAYLHQLIRKGRVCCNGQPLTEETVVTVSMRLTLPESSRLLELADVCGLSPRALLYEDRTALVVAKPAGLAVHRAVGHDDNLAERVTRFFGLRHASYRAAPVHRLDIGTSGPVLFGKGRHAVGRFGQMLMAGRIQKHYLALVTGNPPAQGALTTPVPDGAVLKPALTRYRCLAAADHHALLDLELLTGRPHQIRRQLADAGWPIIGDRRYGGKPWPGFDLPFLHCHRLCFPALDTEAIRRVDSPLPAAPAALLAAMGMAIPPEFFQDAENPADFSVKRL